MGVLQDAYNEFCSNYWAHPDPKQCGCRGSGYALSDLDTWHDCPYHFKPGQRHPEDQYCPECGDGNNFSPTDCKFCGEQVSNEMKVAFTYSEPLTDGEIPF